MTNLPKLYPGHQHQWTDADPALFTGNLVRCIVCEFTVPRNLANLDGLPARPEDPIEMGFGPTEIDIEQSVARANRKHQPVTEWVPLGVASDEVTEETTTETEWGTETHRTYADGGSSLSVDVPVTDQALDAVMAEHTERDGICEICGVRWPCGPWVTAREAWDDLDDKAAEPDGRSPAHDGPRCVTCDGPLVWRRPPLLPALAGIWQHQNDPDDDHTVTVPWAQPITDQGVAT